MRHSRPAEGVAPFLRGPQPSTIDPSQVTGSDDAKRKAFMDVASGLQKRIDMLAALPLEKLDAMSMQSELRKLASV